MGGGGGGVVELALILVGVTWGGRYDSGPGAAGGARGGFGAVRGTSSLKSSSLSWFLASWL